MPLANPKNVPVRMTHMHFADMPRHASRWECHVQLSSHASSVDLVNIVHPHRHPHTLVCRLVSAWPECVSVRPFAAAALTTLAKEDLAFAGTDRPETGRRTPLPALSPAQLLKPRETRGDVGYVQYWGNVLSIHGLRRITRTRRNTGRFSPCDGKLFLHHGQTGS